MDEIMITYNGEGSDFGFGLFINSSEFKGSFAEKTAKTDQIYAKMCEIIEIAKTIN